MNEQDKEERHKQYEKQKEKQNEKQEALDQLRTVADAHNKAVEILRNDRAHEHHERMVAGLADMVIAKAFLTSYLTMLERRG